MKRVVALLTKVTWRSLAWILPALVFALAVVVLIGMGLRALPPVRDFIDTYPGVAEIPAWAPVGFPAWLTWQHFFNTLLILLIIRSGWRVRTVARPPAMWTRRNAGLLRTRTPPKAISLDLWWHLTLDLLWVVNGAVFYVMLFATGQWVRIVPTSWSVFPNAVSVAVQYASLDWPTENGWVAYNALQLLAYFVTVFLAAPAAIVTGVRMSGLWPPSSPLTRLYPVAIARAVHFPVMLYFVLFIVAHVTLVLATGALRNLNHMYATTDEVNWVGFGIFAGSLVIMAVLFTLARPTILRPLAALTGGVGR